ncbi:MAG: PAS domain S-box protein [Burkholderiales bacterium]|nr:PAS domain S-box protein [Burkholderiales bacterium]
MFDGDDPQAGRSSLPDSNLLARAFQAAPNGFVVIDGQGRITAVNAALETMFGRPPGSLLGEPVETLLPDAVREMHRGHRAGYFRHPEPRAMGAGRILYGRRADGHEFPVEIGLNPLPSAQGPLVLASVVDISERMALEWSFRGLFDASPFGLVIVDDEGLIAMVNRVLAESLGYTQATLAGKPLSRLLPERYRGLHDGLMQGYHAKAEARMMGRGRDLTALHADGTELPVEIGLSRVRWQGRAMTLAAVSDISVRNHLEKQLRQANANLEEFTYVASHDLRSPLRGIADLIDWVRDELEGLDVPVARRNLDRASLRVQRMERLIDDLLSYARAGRAATEFASVDLTLLLRGILDMQPLPPAMALELDIDAEPFLATPTPLEATLRNLLGNAVKHHDRASGRIRVSARHDDRHCVIMVADDGPGIPAGAQERVFKLFQTAGNADRGSSGIGLAVAKRLAEVHGGSIELVSPLCDGRGTCLRLRWPRYPQRSSHE